MSVLRKSRGRALKIRSLPIVVALLVVGAFALAGSELPSAPMGALAAKNKAAHRSHAISAPRKVAKAEKLARRSISRLVSDYDKGHAKSVCTGLTAKARKTLGGNVGCVSKVRLARGSKPISKVSIKKIAFRHDRVWANISGYLNGDRKHRLVASLKWEDGRYRLDLSLAAVSRLFG